MTSKSTGVDRWSPRDRLKTTFYRRAAVIARDVAYDGLQHLLPPPAGFRVADLSTADGTAYAAFRPSQGEEIFHRLLDRGARCTAVLRDGDIVHAGWSILGRGPAPYLDRDLLLGAGDVFIFDAHTLPGARLGAAAALRSEHLRRVHQALGCARSLAIVATENTGGASYNRALGYREIGHYVYWRLGPWRRWSSRPLGEEALPDLVEPA